MRWHILLVAMGVSVGIAGAAAAQSATTKIAPQKGWRNDLDAAKALARKTGKPLMVVFRCDP